MKVDLRFPARSSDFLAADHGYELFGALSRLVPWIHQTEEVAVHPIGGELAGERRLRLTPRSAVILRVEDIHIAQLLPLVGQTLHLGKSAVTLGAPQVFPLHPLPQLRSRLVTIKDMVDPETFQAAARRQLTALGCAELVVPNVVKRRTFRVRDKEIVGFEVVLEGLSASESILVQEQGIGGRRHMGCGVFSPMRS